MQTEAAVLLNNENVDYRTGSSFSASGCARCSIGFVASVRFKAVLTSARWENACGKLPTNRPDLGSYSSLSRPTSLQRLTRRLNRLIASVPRFCITYTSASQKLQARNAPSPGGSPSTWLSVL